MNEFVFPGLVKRRAMLAGEWEAAQSKARQLHADIATVDAVIRQLDPAYLVDAIASKRPRGPACDAMADMARTVLDVLRRADGPLTLPAVAERIMALRGLDPSSGAVRAAVEGSAGRALRYQRGKGGGAEPTEGEPVGVMGGGPLRAAENIFPRPLACLARKAHDNAWIGVADDVRSSEAQRQRGRL